MGNHRGILKSTIIPAVMCWMTWRAVLRREEMILADILKQTLSDAALSHRGMHLSQIEIDALGFHDPLFE